MEYVEVQSTRIPKLGFGTWQLSGQACREAVSDALEIGYRHIDTAQGYDNESQVGRGIRDSGVDRDDVFLTTKIWHTNLAPDAVRRSSEESLRALDSDYVDLLLIHWPAGDVPIEATLDAMMELVEEDKVRHIGVSNFTPSLLKRALDHAPILCNQVEYHPFLDQRELCAMAAEHDLMLTAYSPLARAEVFDDETLAEIGRAHGKSPAQVALRWLVQQQNVAAIPKASGSEHRRENLDIFDFSLSEDEMQRIFEGAGDRRLIDPSFAPDWES